MQAPEATGPTEENGRIRCLWHKMCKPPQQLWSFTRGYFRPFENASTQQGAHRPPQVLAVPAGLVRPSYWCSLDSRSYSPKMTDFILNTSWHSQLLVALLDLQLSARFGHVTTAAQLGQAPAKSDPLATPGNRGCDKDAALQEAGGRPREFL